MTQAITVYQATHTEHRIDLPGGQAVAVRQVLLGEWGAWLAACAQVSGGTAEAVGAALPGLAAAGETAVLWEVLRYACDLTPDELLSADADDLAALWAAIAEENRRALCPVSPAGEADPLAERQFLALLLRAGLDPRDPALTVNLALSMAEAQAAHERHSAFQSAYLHAVAIAAGMHGSREAWDALERGLHERATPAYDAQELAQLFGRTPAEIETALAKGWRPPRVRRE